ncbi:MAG: hypothetical protein ACKOPQ_07520 [Novosphingobium sp.]
MTMPSDLFLRVTDSLLALLFLWLLILSIKAGRLCGERGFQSNRRQRPVLYGFGIFLLALMVLHFGGLAWVGQKLG